MVRSPTGHTYRRRARQTIPPDAWIRTGGTSIAEHLDNIATMRTWHTPTTAADIISQYLTDLNPDDTTTDTDATEPATDPGQHGTVQDRLTDALLRHGLNNPTTIEYTPDPNTDIRPEPSTNDPTSAQELDDDPPPF